MVQGLIWLFFHFKKLILSQEVPQSRKVTFQEVNPGSGFKDHRRRVEGFRGKWLVGYILPMMIGCLIQNPELSPSFQYFIYPSNNLFPQCIRIWNLFKNQMHLKIFITFHLFITLSMVTNHLTLDQWSQCRFSCKKLLTLIGSNKYMYLNPLNFFFLYQRIWEEVWYFESGCSRNMPRSKINTVSLKEVKGPRVIFWRNDKNSQAKEIGELHKNGLKIKDIAYVEGLKYNLLNTSQFYDKGYYVEFSKKTCLVINEISREIVLTSIWRRKMNVVDWIIAKSSICLGMEKEVKPSPRNGKRG